MANIIKCPHCGEEFEISEGMLSHLKEEVSLEAEKKIRAQIENEKSLELQGLQKELTEKNQKIDDLRKTELEIREEKRKLEDAKKDLELETQRRLDEERGKIEEDTARRLLDEHHFKDLEKDKKIADMMKQIEDLKRTSLQGSMQTQGEVGELELEKTLRELFPTDEISEVKKGELGGDVRQIVRTVRGTNCGLIIWERKITKAWTEGWVEKLKEDIRRDSAQLGVIVTETLPKDFKKSIGEKEGIWVTTKEFVEPLSKLLRKILYDVAKEKAVKAGKQTKAEEVYDFITSSDFISQINEMAEIYQNMKNQISKERAVAEKQWKQREMQVERLSGRIAGVYGSLQGIAGTALPQVRSLELEDGEGGEENG